MKKYNVCFLFVFFSLTSLAQDTIIENKLPIVFKTNITHYIAGDAFISCEKFFNKNQIEVGIGVIYRFHPWIKFIESETYSLGYDILSDYYSTGISFKIQNKFILNKWESHSNIYLSPLFMYKYVSKNNVWVYYPDGEHNTYNTGYSLLESDKKDIYAFEFLFGYEKFNKNKILIDFYAGLGVRKIVFSGMVNDIEINNSNISNYFKPYSKSNEDRVSISLQLGINIGLKLN
jgi:hypothetical protein